MASADQRSAPSWNRMTAACARRNAPISELEAHEPVVGPPLAARVDAVRDARDEWRGAYVAPVLDPRATHRGARRSNRTSPENACSTAPASAHAADRRARSEGLARTLGSEQRGRHARTAADPRRRADPRWRAGRRLPPAPHDHAAADAPRRGSAPGRRRRVLAAADDRCGPREVASSAPRSTRCAGGSSRSSRPSKPLASARGAGARADALERRARAVRLRRLARSAGAAAQGRELLPALRSATATSSTRAPSSTSSSPSTARSGCRR